jgi:hypothetical protein
MVVALARTGSAAT